jgi:ribosomal protein L11 methyltransferase
LSSFIAHSPLPGQHELVIDPGQAFGTGGHESTQLVLQWIDALDLKPTEKLRVLDVGTGSGVLLMAALCLGARRGLGFDLDIDAVREARIHGIKNGLADRLDFMAGPIDALRAASFDLVFANLLRTEMLPIAAEISERVAVGGKLILAGLLSQDLSEVLEVFSKHGLELDGKRQLSDDSGELWVAPLLIRRS